MNNLMNKIVIAPIVDKEHLVIDGGWGYNKSFTDGIFTVTHIDTLPQGGQADFSDRVAAL